MFIWNPDNPPKSVQLQFYSGGWEHRARWGAPAHGSGACGGGDFVAAETIPETGHWVRLEVPITDVGLKAGDAIDGWGGEFGRTSYCQGSLTNENYGRDHHPACFTIWMAGGGVKAGVTIGQTDPYGVNIIDSDGIPTKSLSDDAFHIRDLNATILNQFGINHEKLVVRYRGLDEKLTSVQPAHVMKNVLQG